MPLFDFKCKKCGHEFEEDLPLKGIDKVLWIFCKKCKKGPAERLITNPKHYKHLSWGKWKV